MVECEHKKLGLNGDADDSYSCSLTGSPNADHRGFNYDPCTFKGKDFTQCPHYKSRPEHQVPAQTPPLRTESTSSILTHIEDHGPFGAHPFKRGGSPPHPYKKY